MKMGSRPPTQAIGPRSQGRDQVMRPRPWTLMVCSRLVFTERLTNKSILEILNGMKRAVTHLIVATDTDLFFSITTGSLIHVFTICSKNYTQSDLI